MWRGGGGVAPGWSSIFISTARGAKRGPIIHEQQQTLLTSASNSFTLCSSHLLPLIPLLPCYITGSTRFQTHPPEQRPPYIWQVLPTQVFLMFMGGSCDALRYSRQMGKDVPYHRHPPEGLYQLLMVPWLPLQ